MADIQRYICGSFIANPSGSFVTHSDHEAAIWAAVAETARRCAEIAGKLADEYRAKYKGTPVDGVRRGGTYDQHDDGMSDGAAMVEDVIRKEFPEAFK